MSIFRIVSVVICVSTVNSQVYQFGSCPQLPTVKYFDLERFLGKWYVIARFPTHYEDKGNCAYKNIHYCGRRIEIEHVFVREGVQYVIHMNSTYLPGADAVFAIQENNIDPIGIPLNVLSTDYTNYALVFGCRRNEAVDLKYMTAWVLSRSPTLPEDLLQELYSEIDAVPSTGSVYLKMVEQRPEMCPFYWTAHVQAIETDPN